MSTDGFLGKLKDYNKFIVMDALWDFTSNSLKLGNITRPNGESTVTNTVGLLNVYEYQSSNNGLTDGYLNNGTAWWTITPASISGMHFIRIVDSTGNINSNFSDGDSGVRPSINLKSNVVITGGDGTKNNPFTLE